MRSDRYKHMDYQSVELFAALSGQSVARLEQRWRQEIETKVLPSNTTLQAALNKLPAPWIDGICACLGIPVLGTRREKVAHIVAHLRDKTSLQKVVQLSPGECCEALDYILQRNGCVKYGEVSRRFGDEAGDGWWWDKKPPQSTLGRLRLRGLLFIGRAPVGGRLYKVAIIPDELRTPLACAVVASRVVQMAEQVKKRDKSKFYRTLAITLADLEFRYATFATQDEAMRKYYERFMSCFEKAAYPGQRNAEGFAEEEYLWNFRMPTTGKFLIDHFLERHGDQISQRLREGMLNWRGAELKYCRILAAKDLLLLEDLDTGQKIHCLCLNIALIKVFRKRVGDAVIGYVSPWNEETHCFMGYCAVAAVRETTKELYQDLKQTLRGVTAKTEKYFAKRVRGERDNIPEVFRRAFEE